MLDQAIGADDVRLRALRRARPGRLPAVPAVAAVHLPAGLAEKRKLEVSELILAALRGFLIDQLTSGNNAGAEAGFRPGAATGPGGSVWELIRWTGSRTMWFTFV